CGQPLWLGPCSSPSRYTFLKTRKTSHRRIPSPERLAAEPFSTDSGNQEGSTSPRPSLSQYKPSRHNPEWPWRDLQSIAGSGRYYSDIARLVYWSRVSS